MDFSGHDQGQSTLSTLFTEKELTMPAFLWETYLRSDFCRFESLGKCQFQSCQQFRCSGVRKRTDNLKTNQDFNFIPDTCQVCDPELDTFKSVFLRLCNRKSNIHLTGLWWRFSEIKCVVLSSCAWDMLHEPQSIPSLIISRNSGKI